MQPGPNNLYINQKRTNLVKPYNEKKLILILLLGIARAARPQEMNLSEGEVGKVIVNGATTVASGGLGSKISTMQDAGKLTKESSGILQFVSDVNEKIINTVTNIAFDKNKNK